MPVASSNVQVRTRGNTAVVTTPCVRGETHQVRFTREQVTESVHDPDADAVLAALGGEAHPCQRAVNAFTAAHALCDAWLGVADIPEATYRRGRWSHPHTCSSTRCSSASLAHVTSPVHVAGFFDADAHSVKVLARWLMRGQDAHLRAPTSQAEAERAVQQRYATWDSAPSPAARSHRITTGLRMDVVSPAFAQAASHFVGRDIHAVLQLRAGGVRAEWIADLAQRVPAHVAQQARTANPHVGRALAKTRNVPPRSVAGFLRAGVVAHFHTYHRHQVTAAQVLQVWHGSGQQSTLAQLLKDGWSVPQALERFSVS